MQWETGDTVVRCFSTQSAAGTGSADADSLPTGTLVINGVDDGANVTVTHKATGSYSASITLPTIADGDSLELRINATVGGVPGVLCINLGQGNAPTGSGANTINITVDDGTDPIEGAKVRVTKGVLSYLGTTDVNGEVADGAGFAIDDGTWTVAITAPGYTFTPTTLVVSGDDSHTYSMTAVAVTPSSPGQTTGYVTVNTNAGVAVAGVTVECEILKYADGSTGNAISQPRATATTDVNGLAQFPNLPRLAKYQVRIVTAAGNGEWFKGTTADATTTPLASLLGVPT